MMKRVAIVSRFRGKNKAEQTRNRERIKTLVKEAFLMGVAPFASHLFYTEVLDDALPGERTLGMLAGDAWLAAADEIWIDDGKLSEGMRQDIKNALALKKPIHLFGDPQPLTEGDIEKKLDEE